MQVKIMNARVLYKAQRDQIEGVVKVLRWEQALKDLVVLLASSQKVVTKRVSLNMSYETVMRCIR